jgi:hypothetical protein
VVAVGVIAVFYLSLIGILRYYYRPSRRLFIRWLRRRTARAVSSSS